MQKKLRNISENKQKMKRGFQGCVLPYFGSRCQVALPTYAAQKEARAANRPLMCVIRLGERGSGGCLHKPCTHSAAELISYLVRSEREI